MERDLAAERRACALAEANAARALALLEEAESELDAVGLFGVGGVAKDAARVVRKLAKRAASVHSVDAESLRRTGGR